MADNWWQGTRRRLARALYHADPVLRWQMRAQLALTAILIIMVFTPGTFEAGFPLLTTCILITAWTKHTRRAERMMGRGGLAEASLWAIRNGDLAIRLGYAIALFGILLLVLEAIAAALGPADGGDFRSSDASMLGFLILTGALLLTTGHMGAARRRGIRHPYGTSRALLMLGGVALFMFIAGLAYTVTLSLTLNSLLRAPLALAPGMLFAGFCVWMRWHNEREAARRHRMAQRDARAGR